MSDLVEQLCNGEHPVEASLREKTREALKQSIERGHIQVKFTGTRGGTVLGIPLDRNRCDLRGIEHSNGYAEISLVGDLMLDYQAVTCVARINLDSLEGVGHLERR